MYIKDTAWGRFVIGNDNISREIDRGVYHDEFLIPIFNRYITKEMNVIEAGANCGFHSVHISRLAKKLYCFEPQHYIFNQLKQNLELNNCTNVEIYNLACYDHECRMRPENGWPNYAEPNFAASLSFVEDLTGEVRAIKLDDFLENKIINMIKVDAEKSDYFVIKGAMEIIKKNRPIIVFEFCGPNESPFRDLLKDLDYKFQLLSPNDCIAIPQ